MASSFSSSLHTLSISLPTHKRGSDGTSLNRLLPSPLRKPMCLTVKAIKGEEGRGNLDDLQRASTKLRQQQQQPSQQPSRRISHSAAPVGLWDRFPSARTVQQMMDTMERIMDDPLAYNRATSFSSPSNGDESMGGYRRGRTPWEIKEGEGEYKIRFDIPGMTKRDVKVYVEEKMLVVKAEKREEEGDEWSSKSYGLYNTRIALPDNVEMEKIKAEVKDGVLYITIPKVLSSGKVLDIDVQ